MNETTADNRKRIESVDLFRAFGIILMIMGHIKFGSVFDKWIHAFHMPMFFFVSGWFFRQKESLGAQIRKLVRSLLIPYIVFELVQWAVLLIFIPEYRTFEVLRYVFWENTYKIPVASGASGISPIPGAMWFLTALFLAEILYIFLDRILGQNWKLHVVVAVLAVLGMLLPRFLPFRLPWALDAALTGLGFFHLARTVRGTKLEALFRLKWWLALIILAVFTASILLCPAINLRTGEYGWYAPFWVNALGMIVALWNLAAAVEKLLTHGKVLQAISTWLRNSGKNSIVYLCLNQSVILALTVLLNLLRIRGAAGRVVTLVLTMAVLFGLEKLICNTKCKVIIGK